MQTRKWLVDITLGGEDPYKWILYRRWFDADGREVPSLSQVPIVIEARGGAYSEGGAVRQARRAARAIMRRESYATRVITLGVTP